MISVERTTVKQTPVNDSPIPARLFAGGDGTTGGGGTGSVSVDTSLSTSGFTETYTYTLSATSGTFSLATNVEKQALSLALF